MDTTAREPIRTNSTSISSTIPSTSTTVGSTISMIGVPMPTVSPTSTAIVDMIPVQGARMTAFVSLDSAWSRAARDAATFACMKDRSSGSGSSFRSASSTIRSWRFSLATSTSSRLASSSAGSGSANSTARSSSACARLTFARSACVRWLPSTASSGGPVSAERSSMACSRFARASSTWAA